MSPLKRNPLKRNARSLSPWGVALLSVVLVGACSPDGGAPVPRSEEGGAMMIRLTSPAFQAGQPIPSRYTADGADVSPPLSWSGVPEGTRSLALVCDDPDAPRGTWVHWVLYGLPPTVTELPEGVPADPTTPQGAKQGTNDFGRLGYGGPAPPPGKPHRYFFKIYALDIVPDLAPGASKQELLSAMEGHILAQGELMGTYKR